MTKTNEKVEQLKRYLREAYPDPRPEHALCGLLDEIVVEKDKEREEAVAEERERIINILPRLEEITAWRELGEATYAIRSAVEALTQTNNKQT